MKLLKKADKDEFLDRLRRDYDLYDVTGKGLPPKQYFFPPEETTFIVSTIDNTVTTPPPPRDFVLYGLTLRELEAVTFLDEIMSSPSHDYYYFRRRRRAVLIGVTGEPFEVGPGGDVILSAYLKDSYRVQAITPKGEEIIKKYMPGIEQGKGVAQAACEERTMPRLQNLFMDTELLKDAVEWSWKGYPEIWDRLAKECMGCGICTYVCPLCHCFSVEDSMDLSGKTATRCRKWDACTLPGFAKVAGGHNFHRGIRERYYNWYYHKFVRSFIEFGRAQCVACGNCKKQCPARIDIEEVLLDIVEKYKRHTG